MKQELTINAPKGISEITNTSDILTLIDDFRGNELETVRFVLLIGIRKDGSVFSQNNGFVSPLELQGLKVNTEEMLDTLLDMVENE